MVILCVEAKVFVAKDCLGELLLHFGEEGEIYSSFYHNIVYLIMTIVGTWCSESV
jgi:hypothetical protein